MGLPQPRCDFSCCALLEGIIRIAHLFELA
eukprot:COSAG02_NODE_4943_length_4805_cov_20.761581_1_plen_29_part_10